MACGLFVSKFFKMWNALIGSLFLRMQYIFIRTMTKANNKSRKTELDKYDEHYNAYNKWVIFYSENWLKYDNCHLIVLFISLEDKLTALRKAVCNLTAAQCRFSSFSVIEYALFYLCQQSIDCKQHTYWLQCIKIVIKHFRIRSNNWGFSNIDIGVDVMGWLWNHQCFYQDQCRF